METIKTYIENIFIAFPDNERTRNLKSELIRSSEEKYLNLIKEGKSEEESIGIIIKDFGDASDLADELGYAQEAKLSKDQYQERKNMAEEL